MAIVIRKMAACRFYKRFSRDYNRMAFNILHHFCKILLLFLRTFECVSVLFLEYAAKLSVIEIIATFLRIPFVLNNKKYRKQMPVHCQLHNSYRKESGNPC